jgi:hypothetical protein
MNAMLGHAQGGMARFLQSPQTNGSQKVPPNRTDQFSGDESIWGAFFAMGSQLAINWSGRS